MNKTLNSIKILILAIVLSLGLQYAFAAWSDPTSNPPGDNTPAPINVSSETQTKSGGLIAWGGGVFTGNGVWANQYCDENGNNCNPITSLVGGGDGSTPTGMIAMFAGLCPSGWSEYTAMRGRVPRGEPTGNTGSLDQGGSDDAIVVSHSHSGSVEGNTSSNGNHSHSYTDSGIRSGKVRNGSQSTVSFGSGGRNTNKTGSHKHPFSANFDTDSTGSSGSNANIPAYQEVIFCIKN